MAKDLVLVLLADTHELHREVEVPRGDILIHAGDFTMFSKSLSAIRDFNEWIGELPHQHKIVVPGNHDFFLEDSGRRWLLWNAALLIDEEVTIEGLRIWGSPVTPLFSAAFGVASPNRRQQHWARVPEGVDILVTHGPPAGVLDRLPGNPEPMGDPELRKAVERIQPMVHVFGHVHSAYGQKASADTLSINCALLGADGDIAHQPVVLRLPHLAESAETSL